MTRIVKCSNHDKEWLFNLHAKTLKNYVETVYGWEDSAQWRYFNDDEKLYNYHIITKDSKRVGAINYVESDVITINRIEILPEYQNQKIGTGVLKTIMCEAEDKEKKSNSGCSKSTPQKTSTNGLVSLRQSKRIRTFI